MMIRFSLNGSPVKADVRPDEMLLEVLRSQCGLTSVRVTCEIGVCGACTALVDGDLISTCLFLAPLADGRTITTVDGLGGNHVVQEAFLETNAMQCGYCTPGMILTAKGLLEDNPAPTETEIKVALGGNLCRCGCYVKIVEAVQLAAGRIQRPGSRP